MFDSLFSMPAAMQCLRHSPTLPHVVHMVHMVVHMVHMVHVHMLQFCIL